MTLSFRPLAKHNVKLMSKKEPRPFMKTLFLGLWPTRASLCYSVIHFLRCLTYAAAVVFLVDYPLMQVLAFMVPTLIMLGSVCRNKHHMWRDRIIFTQHLGNEICIYCASVFMMLFTAMVPEENTRLHLSWAYLGLVAFNILFNVIVVAVIVTRRISLHCRRCSVRDEKQVVPVEVKMSIT